MKKFISERNLTPMSQDNFYPLGQVSGAGNANAINFLFVMFIIFIAKMYKELIV